MESDPQIPFGYKLVTGQLQKGDGIWNGTRFAKARKEYPFSGNRVLLAIRKCEVVQTEITGLSIMQAAVPIAVAVVQGGKAVTDAVATEGME